MSRTSNTEQYDTKGKKNTSFEKAITIIRQLKERVTLSRNKDVSNL